MFHCCKRSNRSLLWWLDGLDSSKFPNSLRFAFWLQSFRLVINSNFLKTSRASFNSILSKIVIVCGKLANQLTRAAAALTMQPQIRQLHFLFRNAKGTEDKQFALITIILSWETWWLHCTVITAQHNSNQAFVMFWITTTSSNILHTFMR